jgi:hypothetical protein
LLINPCLPNAFAVATGAAARRAPGRADRGRIRAGFTAVADGFADQKFKVRLDICKDYFIESDCDGSTKDCKTRCVNGRHGVVIAKSFDMTSPLPREECVRRLQASVDRSWLQLGGQSVIGYVGQTKLRLHKRIWYRNSFQQYLFSKLQDENGHTRLRCRLGLHPFIWASSVVWFGFVIVIGGAMSLKLITALLQGHGLVDQNAWMGVAVPIAMLVFGVALQQFCGFLGRNEPEFLVEFLRRCIDACEVQDGNERS